MKWLRWDSVNKGVRKYFLCAQLIPCTLADLKVPAMSHRKGEETGASEVLFLEHLILLPED